MSNHPLLKRQRAAENRSKKSVTPGPLVSLPRLASLRKNRLRIDIFFKRRSDQLTQASVRQLSQVSSMMSATAALDLHIHGHADPQGSDAYNMVLSEYRAVVVQQALESQGVDISRMVRFAHGNQRSLAKLYEYEDYPWERRVTLEIFNDEQTLADQNKLLYVRNRPGNP